MCKAQTALIVILTQMAVNIVRVANLVLHLELMAQPQVLLAAIATQLLSTTTVAEPPTTTCRLIQACMCGNAPLRLSFSSNKQPNKAGYYCVHCQNRYQLWLRQQMHCQRRTICLRWHRRLCLVKYNLQPNCGLQHSVLVDWQKIDLYCLLQGCHQSLMQQSECVSLYQTSSLRDCGQPAPRQLNLCSPFPNVKAHIWR